MAIPIDTLPTMDIGDPAVDKCDASADSAEHVWFERNGEEKDHPRALEDPERVKQVHHSFKRRLSKILRKDDADIASTETALLAQITKIQNTYKTTNQDRHAAGQELDKALRTHEAYQLERQSGASRLIHGIQAFAEGLAEFVKAYSGIIELVRTAGGLYGEVAYQSLSILLIVFENKSTNDTKILEMLNEIRKSLPRLEPLKAINPRTQMKELVASAYKLITEFSRAAARYFARFWRRVLVAVVPMMANEVDELAASIHKCLAEVNAEAMFGLHLRSHKIHQDLGKLSTDNKKLRNDIRALRTENRALMCSMDTRWREEDRRRLEDFDKFLEIQTILDEPNTRNVAVCKHTLQLVFPNSQPPYSGWAAYGQMNPQTLQQCDELRSWSACETSCLLFLCGNTQFQGRKLIGFPHGWLSPAAIYIAEDHMRTAGEHVAFYSCQPDQRTGKSNAASVISSIVSQILSWKPEILRERDAKLRRIFEQSVRDNDGTVPKQELILNARVSLLNALLSYMAGIGVIYIVLDRMDQCETLIRDFMNELCCLVVSPPGVTVKVAVVVETSGGNGNWDPENEMTDRRLYDTVKKSLFLTKQWNQQLLTYHERSRHNRVYAWDNDHIVAN